MTQLYKWMLPNNRTSYRNSAWPVEVGKWTPKEIPVICKSGWHGCEEKDVLTHLPQTSGATLWVVETKGTRVYGDDKFAAPQMRLVREIGTTTERNLRLFAADCADDVLPLFEQHNPNDRRPRYAIKVARDFAEGKATTQERDAAGAAAWDAAGAAAWAIARAAAGAAARAAARDAVWAAARAVARARYSNWLIVRLESDRRNHEM